MLDFQGILNAVVKIVGFVITVALSAGVMFLVYRALSGLLSRIVGDAKIAKALTTLALLLLGLRGLTVALAYITQPELRYLLSSWMGVLNDLAGVIQWVALIVAILFVGYAVQGWNRPENEED